MDLEGVKNLIDALRGKAPDKVTPQTGEEAGTKRKAEYDPVQNQQNHYQYTQYLKEFKTGVQEGTPLSFEAWLAQK